MEVNDAIAAPRLTSGDAAGMTAYDHVLLVVVWWCHGVVHWTIAVEFGFERRIFIWVERSALVFPARERMPEVNRTKRLADWPFLVVWQKLILRGSSIF